MSVKTVLMIEDDPLVMETICDNLEMRGFQTIRAGNALKGLTKLVEFDVDIVLLDINMPDLDGIETLKNIKKNDKTKNIPVLMLTGDAKKEIITQCLATGIADYIVKPVNADKLVTRIKKALEKAKTHKT